LKDVPAGGIIRLRKELHAEAMRLGLHRTESASAESVHCSYCGKEPKRGRTLVRREDGRYICSECTDKVIAALASDAGHEPRLH